MLDYYREPYDAEAIDLCESGGMLYAITRDADGCAIAALLPDDDMDEDLSDFED
jgi:hypothetical protein